MSRLSSLNELINFTKPVSVATNELSAYEWDIDRPLVKLKVECLIHASVFSSQIFFRILSGRQLWVAIPTSDRGTLMKTLGWRLEIQRLLRLPSEGSR